MKSLALSHTPALRYNLPQPWQDRHRNINTRSQYVYQAEENTTKKTNELR